MARRRSLPWVAAVLIALACVPPRPPLQLPAPFEQSGVRIAVDGFYQTGKTIVGLQGTAENITGRDLSACILYFDVLDAQGTKVADALASTSGLAAGQKWRFQAVFMTPFRTSFQAIQPGRVQCSPAR
jgi:hypothetical protein